MAHKFTPGAIPKDIPRWEYDAFRQLAAAVGAAGDGIAAINRGETPDGSGLPLIDNSKYFYKPGIADGQLAYGGTNTGDPLTLSSTTAASKGKIYLGSAKTSMFDEQNQRIGLNTIPSYRLHQYHSSLEAMQRWEGPSSVSVGSITANGTTTITTSASFLNAYVGMIVTGTGVPSGTTVVTWTSSTTLVLSANVSAGSGLTFTFAHSTDTLYVTNGSQYDFVLKSSAGIQLITSSGSAGGQTSAIRFVQQTAIGTTIRNFIEAQSANQNIAITGSNGADGNSIQTLFTYQAFDNWTGSALSHNTRVGVNEDPFDFSSSAAASQPDSLIIRRRTSATSGVATVIIEGSSTETAFAILGNSTGTAPSKTVTGLGTDSFSIRNDGRIRWGTVAAGMFLYGSTSTGDGQLLLLNTAGRTIFDWRDKVAAFSDAANCTVLFASNTTDDGFRLLFGGDGGNILARLGICATAVTIGNTTAGVLTTATGLLEIRTFATTTTINLVLRPMAAQTGRLIKATDSSGTEVAGLTAAGAYFLAAGGALGAVYKSDASGIGSWSGETLPGATGVILTDLTTLSYDDDAVFLDDNAVYYA